VLQELHALSLFALWYARRNYVWVWFSLGAVYWLGVCVLLLVPARQVAKEKSSRIHTMFVFSSLVLALGQVI
jgi:bacteriorhodopsin